MKDSLEYTAAQMTEFHSLLQAKMAKAQKKKSLKAKKEEKGTLEAAKRAAALEAAAVQKAEKERLRKETAEFQARIKAHHAARQERLKKHREGQAKVDEHNAKVNVYLEELSKQQKKLKALRKKQRDIVELQEKVDELKKADKNYKITKEQQQKLERLDQVEEEIEEVEGVEKEVLATCPGELLPNLVFEEVPEPLPPTPAVKVAAGGAALAPLSVPSVSTGKEQIPLARSHSSESVIESATTMEVTSNSAHNSIAISQVPLNERSHGGGGLQHASSSDAHSLRSPGGSAGESQFTTPFSFSPVHARANAVEPRKAFWGPDTSSTASTSGGSPGKDSNKSGHSGGASAGASAMDVDNWRAKRPVVASLSSSAPTATGAAVSSSGAAWRSPTVTQAVTGAASSASASSASGGWARVPRSAASATSPVKPASSVPVPTAPAAVVKKATPAPDAWVTASTGKKKGAK